ncbi:MAG: HDOD domain-containing protein [Gammaproteobacteria bacterium]|nr:HDOD domain-containing protein [Gammaproteobacteria bacterium]
MSEQSEKIYELIKEELLGGKIKLPGLPDIARRVQLAINNPDYNASDIAKIVQTDIPLSGRIIQVANSPLYQGVTPVENCQTAITRLGMKVVKNLVTSFAVRRLYSGKSSLARKKIEQLWKHSVKIGAISFTLARITPGFDPERAMLAGLVHGIGELLILDYAEKNSGLLKNEKLYKEVIQRYQHKIGAVILKQWRFDQALIQVALSSEDWFRNPSLKPDYADVIMVSHIEERLIKNNLPAEIKNYKNLPVYEKFPVFKLGDSAHKELLMEAQDEIAELQKLLS